MEKLFLQVFANKPVNDPHSLIPHRSFEICWDIYPCWVHLFIYVCHPPLGGVVYGWHIIYIVYC